MSINLLRYLIILIVVPLILSACGPNQQQKALRVALTSVNVARDGFLAWDREHQQAVVDRAANADQARARLDAYRRERNAVSAAFETAYKVIAIAAIEPTKENLKAVARAVFDLLTRVDNIKITSPARAPQARIHRRARDREHYTDPV